MTNNDPVCRACLYKCAEDDHGLASTDFQSYKYVFAELTLLQVSEEDCLPKCLCTNCSELLQQFKKFKETCIKSDEHLRKSTLSISMKTEIEDPYANPSVLPFEEVKLEDESDENQEEIFFDNIDPTPKPLKQKSVPKKRKSKRKRRTVESEDEDDDDSYRKTKSIRSKRRDSYEDSELESDVSVKREPAQKTYKCPEEDCDKLYRSQAALEAHQREHVGEDPTVCVICNKKLSTIKSMLKHKKTHEKIKKEPSDDSMKRFHKCTAEGCRKSYRLLATLEAHMRTHDGDGTESTVCDICEKPLSSIRNMLRHKRTHRSVEERSFKCAVCYKIMINEFSLKNHMRTHDNMRSHVCDICGMSFVTNSALTSHKQTHNTGKPYPCKLCPKTFKSSVAVYCHVKRNHEKECSVACSICGKTLPTKKCLFRHCKITHTVYTTTENVYACKQCDVKCKTKTILRNHERLHSGERKYACPICPKTFAHSNILKKHSYFHSGERPVHCDICDKGFYQKCALDIHMNVHKRQWIAQGVQGITLIDLNRPKKKNCTIEYDNQPAEQSAMNSYGYA